LIVLEPILSKVFFVIMDFFNEFNRYLEKVSIPLSKEQQKLFYEFYQFLTKKNLEINFTRLHDLDDIIKKHFIDSIIIKKILEEQNIPIPNQLMDLGTGGGFPGIPLAILSPENHFILVESRKNRVDYLKELINILNLRNVEVVHKTLTYKDNLNCNGVITRAFERIKETAIRTTNSLEKDGLLILLKGPNCEEEIREMNSKFFSLLLDYDYTLPEIKKTHEKDKRKLIVFKKNISKETLLEPVNRYYFKLREYINIKSINSDQNVFFKKIKKLEESKEIKKQNLALVAGNKIIRDYIKHYPENIVAIVFNKQTDEKDLKNFYLTTKEKNPDIEYNFISSELIQQLELNQYKPPYLMVKISPLLPIEELDINQPFLILPLQDPSNLGACVRSAYAFGIKNIVLLKESCNPYLLKSIKSSAGSVFYCNFFDLKSEDRIHFLEKIKIPIFILDTTGKDITTLKKILQNFGLILGEEGKGIPQDLENLNFEKITIPMKTPIDSLNVSVACGITLFYLTNLT